MPSVPPYGGKIITATKTAWVSTSATCAKSWNPNPAARVFCSRCGASATSWQSWTEDYGLFVIGLASGSVWKYNLYNSPEMLTDLAGSIRTQSEKLRTLIDDLNLTSKLQYGAQPLRKELFTAGPLVRELVAQFCDSPLADRCELSLTQTPAAEQAQLLVDRALLGRLLENLLSNSVRHNPGPVSIQIQTDVSGRFFTLTVTDDGTGYPPAVLETLRLAEPSEDAPHILGLHVVEQITAAHGGKATFAQNTPHGARTVIRLPIA